jgi:hypothetical protein
MHRLALAVAVLFLAVLRPSSSFAGSNCPNGTTPQPIDGGGAICIPVVSLGNGGGGGGRDTDVGSGRGKADSEDICDLTRVSPQPPPSDPAWQGHSPDDGDLYLCILPSTGTPTYRFVADGADAPPDPAVLARRALDQLRLTVPDIHMAPSPPAKTYVGLATWLWMPAAQWSTLTKSVTAGETTVTVTAVPVRAVWNMGAGATTCHDAGRAWRAGQMSKSSTTDCDYTYQRVSDFQPDKRFAVTATIVFEASWTCAGDCLADEGALGEVDGLPGRSAIRVGERQSVNITGNGR